MTSKICKRCSKSKPLDNFRVTTNGVTTHCISCLDEKNARRAEHRERELANTVASLSSLDHFYLALGVAKENEDITHTIPFHSKGASGVQTVRVSSLGNDHLLTLDPSIKEGIEAYKTLTQQISKRCGDILGYQWRYDI